MRIFIPLRGSSQNFPTNTSVLAFHMRALSLGQLYPPIRSNFYWGLVYWGFDIRNVTNLGLNTSIVALVK